MSHSRWRISVCLHRDLSTKMWLRRLRRRRFRLRRRYRRCRCRRCGKLKKWRFLRPFFSFLLLFFFQLSLFFPLRYLFRLFPFVFSVVLWPSNFGCLSTLFTFFALFSVLFEFLFCFALCSVSILRRRKTFLRNV